MMKFLRVSKAAFKILLMNKIRSFLMMLGFIIGIATLTIIVAAGVGAREKVIEKVKTHGIETIMIRPGAGQVRGLPGSDRSLVSLTIADADAIIEQVPHVKQVTPVQNKGGVEIKYGNRSTTTTIFGATPNWAEVRGWQIESGAFVSQEDVSSLTKECIIGKTVLTELLGGVNPLGEMIRIGNVGFTIKGVFKTKGASLGGGDRDNRILIPITTASRRLFNQTHLNQIMVQVDDLTEMENVAENVTSLLRARHELLPSEPDDFSLRLPKEMIEQATEIADTFTLLLGLISGISLLIGGIVIMNIMLISVSERKQEIGLRKAVGASSKDILLQFVLESLAVTYSGGILGLLVGILGVNIMAMLTNTPAAVSWEVFALAFGFSFVVGIIFGVQPARKAAHLDPIEALRS